jgi:hypothetical protein
LGLKFKAAIDNIWFPLRDRHQKQGKLRRELLAGALHDWQRAPAFGRLGDLHFELKGYTLNVDEFKLLTGDTRYDHWTGHGMEPTIVTELVTMSIDKKQCRMHGETLVAISLHALAERFERRPCVLLMTSSPTSVQLAPMSVHPARG